jgi:NhaA family Na+:H+ antiporter
MPTVTGDEMPFRAIREFLRLEAAAGIILFGTAVLAVIADNSPLAPWYDALFDLPVSVRVGALVLDKPLLLWINDGLMAVFFLLVGLEIKRELAEGELSSRAQAILPFGAALSGMLVPAAIYAFLNRHDPVAVHGWAIPSATDIAFALGVLSLLGSRVPLGIKIFLMAVAVLDDLGAIVVIATFYTEKLSAAALGLAIVALAVLFLLNRAGVIRLAAYLLVGIILWVCVLKSGVHATLAGVAVGLAIPLRGPGKSGPSPLREIEHALHPWVTYGIMPIFAFANAGISFEGLTFARLAAPVPLGIAVGLFVGKQLGIFAAVVLLVRLKLAALPPGATWPMVYGVALLCGIGFTMSLFIGTLAFNDAQHAVDVRLGVIVGSLLSAAVGYAVLRAVTRA